jgi:CRP-like cAMP-binding protein
VGNIDEIFMRLTALEKKVAQLEERQAKLENFFYNATADFEQSELKIALLLSKIGQKVNLSNLAKFTALSQEELYKIAKKLEKRGLVKILKRKHIDLQKEVAPMRLGGEFSKYKPYRPSVKWRPLGLIYD